MPDQADYRAACGMRRAFQLTVRHLSSGLKFERRMESPTFLAGSDPRCDMRLPAELSAGKELLFQAAHGRLYCLELGDSEADRTAIRRCRLESAALEVNGFEVRAFEESGPNAEIEAALHSTPLRGGDASQEPNAFTLVDVRDHGPRAAIPLSRTITVMGRSPRCRVSFNSWAASRFHAVCVSVRDEAWVVDLESRTGTFVNESPVRERRLQVGDRLRIGANEFSVLQGGGREASVALTDSIPSSRPREWNDDSEREALAASIADAITCPHGLPTNAGDSRTILRTTADLMKLQSLPIHEVRRLRALISTEGSSNSSRETNALGETRPESDVRNPRSEISSDPQSDIHLWFQHVKNEADSSWTLSGVLRRLLRGS